MKPPHEPDRRTKNHLRGASAVTIQLVCEAVAQIRGVDAVLMLERKRGPEPLASARSFAMAASAEVGVPKIHVARAFNREWHVVHQAAQVNARKYQNSERFREEWNEVTRKVKEL